MWWDCSFVPLLEMEGISRCPFRIDLRDVDAPLLKTHRLVLSEGGNHDLTLFHGEWIREQGSWHHKYMKPWPMQLRVEPGQKEEYHPASRAIAEIAREHWIWHLWQCGLAPIDRSSVSRYLITTRNRLQIFVLGARFAGSSLAVSNRSH